MAKNNLYGKGTVVPVTAPSGGVTSGSIVAIRDLIGIAVHDAVSGARLELETFAGPVVEVNGDTNLEILVGERVFYDAGNGWVDKTTTAQFCVGVAVPLDTLADVAKVTTGTKVRVLMHVTTPAAT